MYFIKGFTFQEFSSSLWLVTTVLDSTDVEHFLIAEHSIARCCFIESHILCDIEKNNYILTWKMKVNVL